MERIGIFGGTFNPPHTGHIRAALCGAASLKLDRMLIVPSYIPPHKQMVQNMPSPQQRLDMLNIACAGMEHIEVSDIEIVREGISYTWQTLEQLQTQYPDSQFYLFMGTDMFLSLDQWRESEKIIHSAIIAVFYRGDKAEKKLVQEKKDYYKTLGAEVVLIDNPITTISSTDLRRMLVFQCCGSFLPEGVEEYIRANGLYDTKADLKNLPMEQLESTVIGLLNPNRVKHVLGCRDTAYQLAGIWGANETDAARAGMLHDVTKALSGQLQMALCEAYGVELNEFEKEYPKTLHALTGSLVAERIFGENKAVVDAICSHTTGKANMNTLEKIIYVADYMEPNRDFPGVEELRELAFTDLDAALELGLEMTLDHLKEQGSVVSPESAEALAYLKTHRKG